MARTLKHGDAMDRPDLRVVRRFLSKVSENGTGCWEWWGSRSGRHGVPYGQINIRGKVCWVHRVAYAIFNDGIPEGFDVHHTCKNTLCVNPAHLEAVTRSEHGVLEGDKGDGVPF